MMYLLCKTLTILVLGLHFCKARPTNETLGDQANVENATVDLYKIASKDDRDEDILETPIRRPYTRVHSNRIRSLYPVRIIIGESPCLYRKYTYFFDEARNREMLPFDLLMNATVTIHNEDYYFYDPEDLCISVDDELNVDIWQFDCSPAGICVCGIYFGYVDTDIPPKIENQQIKYLQVNGLDRKLVIEDGECRSGLKGHCSLAQSNTSLKNPLKCSNLYGCVLDDSYGPILTNLKTKQIYGLCLPKKAVRSISRMGRRFTTGDTISNYAATNKIVFLNHIPFWTFLAVLMMLPL